MPCRSRPSGLARCVWLLLALVSALPAAADTLNLVPYWQSAEEDLARAVLRPDAKLAVLHGLQAEVADGDSNQLVVEGSPGQSLCISDNGTRVGIASPANGTADYVPTQALEMRDQNGAIVWTIGPTTDTTYRISKLGVMAGLSLNVNTPQLNTLHLYNVSGGLIATAVIPGLSGGIYDPTGQVFIAASDTDGLHAYNSLGWALWSYPDALLYDASNGASKVAVMGADGKLKILQGGSVIGVLAGLDPFAGGLSIAPDGSRVAVAWESQVKVYSVPSLTQIFSVLVTDPTLKCSSVDIGSGIGWLLVGLGRDLGPEVPDLERHPDGEVRAYNAAGVLRHSAALSFPQWNISTPTVALDASGPSATITTRTAVYRTVLP